MSHSGSIGEAAHDLERGDRVLFADRDLRLQPRVDEPLADDVGEVEHVVLRVLQQSAESRLRPEETACAGS